MTKRTIVAQSFFFMGLLLSLFPIFSWGRLSVEIIPILGNDFNSTLTLFLAAALILWLIGDGLLYLEAHQQFKTDKTQLTYVVQQLNAMSAGLIALAPVSHRLDITLRIVCALISAVWVLSVRWESLWHGEFKSITSWLVGTELMAWGVALLGIYAAAGWLCLLLANLSLCVWNWIDYKAGKPGVIVWLLVNLAFMLTALIQFGDWMLVVLKVIQP